MTDDDRIEMVLNEMANIGNGRLSIQKFLSESVNDKDLNSYQRISSFLVNKGFARQLSTIPVLEILPNGRDIVNTGGYLKYIEKIKSDKEEDARLKKIKANLDESNLRLTGFYYKWRWVPFVLSALALVISLLVAIFK